MVKFPGSGYAVVTYVSNTLYVMELVCVCVSLFAVSYDKNHLLASQHVYKLSTASVPK